jgi:hypothetical protein
MIRPIETRVGPHRWLTSEKVLEALSLVRAGQVISLDLPIDAPPLVPEPHGRPAARHKTRMHNQVRSRSDGTYVVVNDDVVEFAPQGSSHWDALAHWGAIEADCDGVFAGGVPYGETYPEFGAKTLGIDALADGVVTRGVLLDLVTTLAPAGAAFLPDDGHVGADGIRVCLDRQGLTLARGDAVLLYTGFQSRVREVGLVHDLGGVPTAVAPGLALDSLDVFGPAQTFALIADNPSVESNPMADGRFHTVALKHLAIYLGELWALEELVTACRADNRWEFALVSSPLYLRGAFGSPANAIALR